MSKNMTGVQEQVLKLKSLGVLYMLDLEPREEHYVNIEGYNWYYLVKEDVWGLRRFFGTKEEEERGTCAEWGAFLDIEEKTILLTITSKNKPIKITEKEVRDAIFLDSNFSTDEKSCIKEYLGFLDWVEKKGLYEEAEDELIKPVFLCKGCGNTDVNVTNCRLCRTYKGINSKREKAKLNRENILSKHGNIQATSKWDLSYFTELSFATIPIYCAHCGKKNWLKPRNLFLDKPKPKCTGCKEFPIKNKLTLNLTSNPVKTLKEVYPEIWKTVVNRNKRGMSEITSGRSKKIRFRCPTCRKIESVKVYCKVKRGYTECVQCHRMGNNQEPLFTTETKKVSSSVNEIEYQELKNAIDDIQETLEKIEESKEVKPAEKQGWFRRFLNRLFGCNDE